MGGRIGEHYRRVFDGTPPSRHVVTNVIVSTGGEDTADTRCRYARGGWRFDRHIVTRSWSV